MSKDLPRPHGLRYCDSLKKKAERIAALLNLDDDMVSWVLGLNLALHYAEAYAKGPTVPVFCTPEQKALLENNPKFIEALCEEGVVEWLTPFVLTKSKRPTTDTHQP